MVSLKLLHLHVSPFSERVRFALHAKRVAYERESYRPVTGEAGLFEWRDRIYREYRGGYVTA